MSVQANEELMTHPARWEPQENEPMRELMTDPAARVAAVASALSIGTRDAGLLVEISERPETWTVLRATLRHLNIIEHVARLDAQMPEMTLRGVNAVAAMLGSEIDAKSTYPLHVLHRYYADVFNEERENVARSKQEPF